MDTLTAIATANRDDLNALPVKELRQLASGQISGYGSLSKADLIAQLLAEGERLRNFARSLNIRQPEGSSEKVVAQQDNNKTKVNVAPLIAYADSVLRALDTLKRRDWVQVSVAIAIATGRRMSEIHGESTKFERQGSMLSFTGQLKASGEAATYYQKNPSYVIPCLVSPDLIVAGHEWLKKQGKVESSSKKAHGRFSRYLSQQVKRVFFEAGVKGPASKHTYKALRVIYAQVSFLKSDANDKDTYIAEILGHGRSDLIARRTRVTDVVTPQVYNSDWVVTGYENNDA
ncbi:MAG: protelomerase family protein [Cyanobacteria bacterium J06634_5]